MRKYIFSGLVTAFFCLILHEMVLGGIPHGWDAVSYFFQARVFADGRIVAPSSPFVDFFWLVNVVNGYDIRYAKYPPGFPFLLALGIKVCAPGVINALSAGACLVLTALLGLRLYGERTSLFIVILGLLSPFYMFMGANYLSHITCCAAMTLFLWSLYAGIDASDTEKNGWIWGILSGAGLGAGFLIRPYSAILFFSGSVFLIVITRKERLRRLVRLVPGIMGSVLIGLIIFLFFNKMTTGKFFLTAYKRYDPSFSFLGEGGFSRNSVWANLRANIPKIWIGLAFHVWGGFLPDIWLVVLVIIAGFKERATRGLIGALLIYCLGHSLYYYFDFYYGPRLVFEAMPFFLMVSARGLDNMIRWGKARRGRLRTLAIAAIVGVACLNFSKTLFVTYPGLVQYYSTNYCGQGAILLREVKGRNLDNAIVFIRSNEAFAFANISHLNSVDLYQSPVLYARYATDDPKRLSGMLREFPRKEHWIVDVNYVPIKGFNNYADRFEITRIKWSRLHIAPATRLQE